MRFIFKFVLSCLLLALILAAGTTWWIYRPIPLQQTPLDFRILPGSSLRAAIAQFNSAGGQVQPTLMLLLARANQAEASIKAGSYSVSAGVTPLQLLDKLVRGRFSQGELNLPEGWTFRQWRARLDRHPDLSHETLELSEAEIAARLGLTGKSLEGWLFPDTYLFDKQSSDLELLARAVRSMQKKLDQSWAQRASGLPYATPYEALIMASIVEKETGRPEDRDKIAAVFVNRLRNNMLLQTDPTVIYGLGEAFDGNLRKKHLLDDTAYNTYRRSGLPPTPISNPGLAALQASLHPASSDALYFVARGDGSSHFSRSLDEHNRAVNKFQRGQP